MLQLHDLLFQYLYLGEVRQRIKALVCILYLFQQPDLQLKHLVFPMICQTVIGKMTNI